MESYNSGLWIALWCLIGCISFILVAFLYRKWIEGAKYTKDTKIPGKIVLITGANTGIGKYTAIDLARRGAKVYIACRDLDRGEAARKEIIEKSESQNVFFWKLDLASFKSIREFATNFSREENQLDILINNAGVMACPRTLTQDGIEMQFGVNHLGHFLLTNLLLELIKSSAPSRIINVSSMGHLFGKINKSDLMGKDSYGPFKAYNQSKLANVLFTKELARRLSGTNVSVYALHPGVINTELGRHIQVNRFNVKRLQEKFRSWFFKSPKQGAQTTLTCALDPDLEQVSGEYFSNCKKAKCNPAANDPELACWLWEESVKLTNLNGTLKEFV